MIAIVPISGFLQSNREPMGIKTHWKEDLRPLSSPDVFVHPPVEWSRDARDILGTLDAVGASELIVVCYSWGCGHGARRLVKQAIHRGIKVRLVSSCDGVWKSALPRWAAWIFSPLSMTSLPSIDFPAAVDRIVGVRQRNNRPAGHDIYRGALKIALPSLNATHNMIDEHHAWRSLSLEAINEVLNPHPNTQ